MKLEYNGIKIECTVDEFEILTKKDLLGRIGAVVTHMGDEWNEDMKKVFEKLWEGCDKDTSPRNPSPFDGVALYGCEAPRDRKDLSPYVLSR